MAPGRDGDERVGVRGEKVLVEDDERVSERVM